MITSAEWTYTIMALVAFATVDLIAAIARRNKRTTVIEAAFWTVIYVGAAITFGLLLPNWGNDQMQTEFFASWLTEYALSVDNIFVFILILTKLKIDKEKQHLVLLIGILLAILLRAIMITAGVTLIERFGWMFFLFGAFLIYTAWKLAFESKDEEWQEGKIIQFLRSKGLKNFTIALFALGITDLLFAFDSIPAVFGLTQDRYVVITANVFALMGLRQLFFLLEELLERLVYLSKGLSVVLGFIGFKLFIEGFHQIGIHEIAGIHLVKIPIEASLMTIASILLVTAVTSLAATRNTKN
ncbi:MAG: TerC family protein [Candidatus Nanopelagicaceae bacterium]